MKLLVLAGLLFSTLVIGLPVQAQRPLRGKPAPFEKCSSIIIETKGDDATQARTRLLQLLDTSIYKVRGPLPIDQGVMLFAQRPLPGIIGTRLLIKFSIREKTRVTEGATIDIMCFYRNDGIKHSKAVLNQQEPIIATAWAIENQLATAYPNSAKLWYQDDAIDNVKHAQILAPMVWDEMEKAETKRNSK